MGHRPMQELQIRGPIRAISKHLDDGLRPGQVGFVVAQPGIGKSALLVHIALDRLVGGANVLHVSLGDSVERVRAIYDQIFRATRGKSKHRERATAIVASERRRMIHSYLDRSFDVGQLRENVNVLKDLAHFPTQMIVIDGVAAGELVKASSEFKALAEEMGIAIWFSARAHQTLDSNVWEYASIGLRLLPEGSSVRLKRIARTGDEVNMPLNLDPNTLLIVEEDVWDPDSAPLSPRPSDCTVYTGGATGSESMFGSAAEKWGINEMNFTFEGHKQNRDKGRYLLSPRELAAGDVSLVYVSRRLKRTYSEGTLIRNVLQTLWHMVSRSQQVFVVGTIQPDGTVVGGTGWSVELAKMWNKSLWVFDQERDGWFTWDGEEWLSGIPVIESIHFTGTGTRYLSENGQRAITDLFERSFNR